MASHAVELVAPLASAAIFLDEGRVKWQGTGPELLKSSHMAHLKSADGDIPSHLEEGTVHNDREKGEYVVQEVLPKTPKQLILEETRAKGEVDMKHWWNLKKRNGSNFFWLAMMILMVMSCLAPVVERKLLS
jgi:ABC-type molybdate transport system ATPase subunit